MEIVDLNSKNTDLNLNPFISLLLYFLFFRERESVSGGKG